MRADTDLLNVTHRP